MNKVFGTILHRENLWHINRRSVSGATAIGLFSAFIPIPAQMVMAALFAIIFRVNVPISIIIVWVSNPLTAPPIFYFCYRVGKRLLGTDANAFNFEFSWQWLLYGLNETWQPLLLGCLICGAIAGLLGYSIVRLYWRYHIIAHWKKRMFK